MTPLPALALLGFCTVAAVWSFRWIIRWYRTPVGFPWILSVIFAAASVGAILALHVLIGH
jgi:hypothetical protein